ncbi:phage minor head protein [Clostridium tetani]|uniref:phage minor head protein n=1 Tax=Clostridium tetani TaxID=1513 RepID=UPI002954DD25|nr:phage minor head protein [Clostridium tetani]
MSNKRRKWTNTSFIRDRANCEKLGISAYRWRTSEDQRVRKSHVNMEGVIVFWDDPPNPEELIGEESLQGKHHAGECEGCRCYAESVVVLDLIKWPSKVYYQGKIQIMTKEQFEVIWNSKKQK